MEDDVNGTAPRKLDLCFRSIQAIVGTPGLHAAPREASATESASDPPGGRERRPPREEARRFADLMRRTFGIDVLSCPRCGGRFRLVALIEEASVIERILRHL
jgi:hypothetical protein